MYLCIHIKHFHSLLYFCRNRFCIYYHIHKHIICVYNCSPPTGMFIQVQSPNTSTKNTTMTELIHVKQSFDEVTPARAFFNSVAAQVETANLSFERFSALQMKILSAVHEAISLQLTEDQTHYTVTVMWFIGSPIIHRINEIWKWKIIFKFCKYTYECASFV